MYKTTDTDCPPIWQISARYRIPIIGQSLDLWQFDEIDKLQQAGKIDNLQQVCGVFGRAYGIIVCHHTKLLWYRYSSVRAFGYSK